LFLRKEKNTPTNKPKKKLARKTKKQTNNN